MFPKLKYLAIRCNWPPNWRNPIWGIAQELPLLENWSAVCPALSSVQFAFGKVRESFDAPIGWTRDWERGEDEEWYVTR